MSELKLLWEIQQLDLEKGMLEKQLRNMPLANELKRLKAEIEMGQEALKKKKETYDREIRRLKLKEDEAASLREKYEASSKDLYGSDSSNAKELAGATAKLEELKEKVDVLDDEIIEIMEKVAEQKQVYLDEMAELNVRKDSFREIRQEYQTYKDEICSKLEKLPGKLVALTKSVTTEKIALYQKLHVNFPDGVVVADTKKGICAGCHMGVSFDIMNQLKSDTKIIYCDHCGRILLPTE